jgi:hypothetical protein
MRKNRRPRNGEYTFAALLVKAERRDGKPYPRLIRYLGRISSRDIPSPTMRRDFWSNADRIFDELKLDPETHARALAKLETVVRRPTPEEIEAYLAAQEARFQAILARHGLGPTTHAIPGRG